MVDIQLSKRWPLSTVLTLVSVAKHQVPTSQAHGDPRGPVVAKQVNNARHAELPADDGNRVIVCPDRQLSPELKVVRFPTVVQGQGHAPVEQNHGALDRGHLNRNEVTVESQDRKRQNVRHVFASVLVKSLRVQPSVSGEHVLRHTREVGVQCTRPKRRGSRLKQV